MNNQRLTAVILVKNEENSIVNCIESVLFCDEILVVDDESTDRTLEVVGNLHNPKITTITNKLHKDFARQRNHALSKVHTEWALFIDADEIVSEQLKDEIVQTIHDTTDVNGYYIKRVDTMWGKKLLHGEVGKIEFMRLARMGKGKWVGKVHETWQITGSTTTLKNELLHFPHPTIGEFLQDINYYTSLRASELYEKKIQVSVLHLFLYPMGKFVVNFFLKSGYKDGNIGFVHATLMSFHSFLVRAKTWLLYKGIT